MTPILTTARRTAAALVVAAAALACAGPGTAAAAEVTVWGPTPSTTLIYAADSGENNKLKVTRLSPGMVRMDDVYGIDVSDHAAGQCKHPYLLDGTVVDCVFIADRILQLNDGNDTVTPAGDNGSDVVSGGSGSDRVEYSDRTNPVTVMIDNEANDGELGEEDNIRGDVEVVTGGAGNDTIVDLLGGANGFLGGPGDDMIVGGDGWDATLVGGDGNDTIYGAGGKDMLWGNAGDDVLKGGAEEDLIDGGSDQDTIGSKDGVKDTVFCGTGIDRISADPFDDEGGCERKG